MIYLSLGSTGTRCIHPRNTISDFSGLNKTILAHEIAFGTNKGQTNDRLSCIACFNEFTFWIVTNRTNLKNVIACIHMA